jgi:hypothetical protein
VTIAPERPTRPRTVHDLPQPDPDWTTHAACVGADFEAFVIHSDNSRGAGNRNLRARKLCASCDVALDCRLAAVREDDRRSIRGGMSPVERDEWLAEQGVRRRPVSNGGSAIFVGTRGPYRAIDMDRLIAMHLGGASQQTIWEAFGCAKETVARRLKAARAEGLIP